MFERYYRELLSFLARKLRDRDAAADLAQESFARVYAAERAGTIIRDPRALLYRTARNLLTDSYRHSSIRAERLAPDPDSGWISDSGTAAIERDEPAGPAALEPETALSARQRFEAIAAVIETLPPRCREVFTLVKFDGLTHAETARRMGIAVKTVEMQVQIALRACLARLDELDCDATTDRSRRLPKGSNDPHA
ncbi:MAG: sigma-70 family RNA polymerase sigma factor [Burkholderiaceae bacterium]